MKTAQQIIYIAVVAMLVVSCGGVTEKKQLPQTAKFSPPSIPTMLTNDAEKRAYLATHYWANFNFADTTLISNADVTEQAFVDFLQVVYQSEPTVRVSAIDTLLTRAISADSLMFAHFTDLAERYLYDPNSPMRSEELYIPFLEFIVGSNSIDEMYKIRPRHQLEMALKNRPNTIAANFKYVERGGKKGTLHTAKSDYTILFFNNPDCTDCKRVKAILAEEPIFAQNPRIKVVAIYTDDDLELWHATNYPASWINAHNSDIRKNSTYDLRAIPTLYLLDKNKRVILKDTPIEQIAHWLNQNY